MIPSVFQIYNAKAADLSQAAVSFENKAFNVRKP